ncbi:hypothetical protein BMF35_a1427 [Aurantiacibacter gangjinensis]|nr:hypothetical protein BMF35_a1427 [Aurantiacibacter gangjinensis]
MNAEIDHVPDTQRLHFAVGCLLAACKVRLASPLVLQAAARNVLIGGAMLWAAMNIRFAGRMSVSDAALLETYGYCTASLFLVGAIATARFGNRATIGLATPLIAAMMAAAAFIYLGLASTATSKLYLALIAENLGVLLIAVAIAGAAARFALARTEFN